MNLRLQRLTILTTLLFLVVGLSFSAIEAQDGSVTLSVSLSDFMRNFITDKTFEAFEDSHPGVKVYINYIGFDKQFAPPVTDGLEAHLQAVEALASSADVVPISRQNLSEEAVRAGYFLDLTPLTSADTSLNVDDFYPTTWQSFQWDGAIWGLPVSTDVMMLIYDPEAFDKAGLGYPNEHWTIDDLANAANTLAQRDTDGKVTLPGLVTFDNTALLLRSLLGQGFYDNSVTPEVPNLSNPDLEALLTKFAELEKDGVIAESITGDVNSAPMRIFGGFGLQAPPDSNVKPPAASLLHGGLAGLDVQGFAVSAGTQYPELAYELAKYLTSNVELATGPLGVSPARRSLVGVQPTPDTSTDGPVFTIGRPAFSPDAQAVIDQALENGLPTSELRYADYITSALKKMNTDNLDAHTALQDAETEAVSNLQAADAKHDTLSILVTPPPVEAVLEPGKISLKFGMQSFINPMPNQDQWDQLIKDFASTDPQVGQVKLDVGFGNVDQLSSRDDCFYLPYNAVPSLQPDQVLNLDPYIDADPGFDKSDFVGNTLAQVQRDNQTWALPIVVMAQTLRYQSELFVQAGVSVPDGGWTIDSFVDALHALKDAYSDKKPFEPRDPGGSYLLMLIAAYGGVPLDFRTNPPTVNFTDPATVSAIQQVLDLAKQGYIDYQELAKTEFLINVNGQDEDLIHTEALNGIRFVVGGGKLDPYKMALFPKGRQFSAESYDVGTAYISANTQNADACYRWISTLAQHPELFSAMPARRSLINDPALATSQGEDAVAVYKQLDALLQDPNTVVFPTPSPENGGSPSNFILQFWLNRAFDNYVLKDADLETELQDAQTYASTFLECIMNVPPVDPATTPSPDAFKGYTDCALKSDPSITGLFSTAGASVGS